ncbi:DUF5994 family protein [Spirillospora sp. CA-255316]
MAHEIIQLAPAPVPQEQTPPEARLSLTPGGGRRGILDGGWWPRSREAADELADLIVALTGPLGMATRVTVDLADWNEVPRRLTVSGRGVKVGWLPNLDHMVGVTCGGMDELLLLVVPPDAPPSSAQAALARAAMESGDVMPQEILASCDISTARPAPPSSG